MSYEDHARAAAQAAMDQVIDETEQLMRHHGGTPPAPRVHMFNDAPYPDQGYVVCRPSRGGADTGDAIRQLGLLPAALRCDRIVLTWEHRSTATLLGSTGNLRSGIVTINATARQTEVTWQAFDTTHSGTVGIHGTQHRTPLWSKRESLRTKLPLPVADAIRAWRQGSAWPIATTAKQLERYGYTVTLRDPGHHNKK